MLDCGVRGWIYGGAIQLSENPCRKSEKNIPVLFMLPVDFQDIDEEKINSLYARLEKFNRVNSAWDLLPYYVNDCPEIIKIMDDVTNNYESSDLRASLDCSLYGLFSNQQLCSECSFESYVNLNEFYNIAITTPDNFDDIVFRLLKDIFGKYNAESIRTLSVHDCDYCWHSKLGDGSITSLWHRRDSLIKLTKKRRVGPEGEIVMDYILKQMARQLIDEMTGNYFMLPRKKVVTAWKKISESFDEKAIESNYINEFRRLGIKLNNSEDIIFDCENKDCASMKMNN